MSAFEKLLGELSAAQTETEDLAKSLTANGEGEGAGEAGAGAAGGGEGGEGGAGAAGGEAGAGAGEGGAGGEGLAKSFKVKTADGQELDAIDGTEMLKALEQRVATGEESLGKALGGLINLVKGQGALIKSLSEQVKALGAQGRGRKTILSITEKAPLAKSHGAGGEGGAGAGEGPTVEEFLMKSEAAWKSGALTGKEFNTIDVACRMGAEIEPGLIKKVMAAGK